MNYGVVRGASPPEEFTEDRKHFFSFLRAME